VVKAQLRASESGLPVIPLLSAALTISTKIEWHTAAGPFDDGGRNVTAEAAGSVEGGARLRLEGPQRAFWAATLLIGLMVLGRDLLLTRWSGDMTIVGGAMWGRDFVNVYSSGTLLLEGRLDILYDVEAYRAWQVDYFDKALLHHNYSYPPVTLLYTWLFALFPYPVAVAGWLAGTAALFAAAARPYLRPLGMPGWVALLAPASLVNFWAGHYGFLIGALWLAAWHHLPRRPALAGVLIGLMIVKPHLALLAPIMLAWRREWIAIATAAATAGLLALASALAFGPELWITYLTETARLQAAMVDDLGTFHITMMPTLVPSAMQLGAGHGLAILVQAAVGLGAIALLLARMPRDSKAAGLAGAAATFLVLPYAFNYDMTVIGLAALILFHREAGQSSEMRRAACCLAALLPMLVQYLNFFGLSVTPAVIAFQLVAMLGLAAAGRRPPARRADPSRIEASTIYRG
jgi:alpha-1,2-mannosyltransferase